jgi:hypothetical protein
MVFGYSGVWVVDSRNRDLNQTKLELSFRPDLKVSRQERADFGCWPDLENPFAHGSLEKRSAIFGDGSPGFDLRVTHDGFIAAITVRTQSF